MASDRATHDFLTWYLTTVTEMYQKAQSALQTRPLDVVRNLFSSPAGPPAAPPPVPAAELEALRLRVQELEDRLRLAEQKTAPRKRKTKKSTNKG